MHKTDHTPRTYAAIHAAVKARRLAKMRQVPTELTQSSMLSPLFRQTAMRKAETIPTAGKKPSPADTASVPRMHVVGENPDLPNDAQGNHARQLLESRRSHDALLAAIRTATKPQTTASTGPATAPAAL